MAAYKNPVHKLVLRYRREKTLPPGWYRSQGGHLLVNIGEALPHLMATTGMVEAEVRTAIGLISELRTSHRVVGREHPLHVYRVRCV